MNLWTRNLSFSKYTLCADGLWRKLVEFGRKASPTILVRGRDWRLIKTEKP